MWQGGLAAGKPSVPWYQIHVRGIPGWRACRRPQARPPRFVQRNNGERSLGPAPGEAAAMQRRMCRPRRPSTPITILTYPRASPRAVRVGRCQCRGTLSAKIGLAPEGTHRLAAGSDVCGMRSLEALHRSVSAARKSRASFRSSAIFSINRTLTLPEHEEGPKEAFEGPGFRRRAQVE